MSDSVKMRAVRLEDRCEANVSGDVRRAEAAEMQLDALLERYLSDLPDGDRETASVRRLRLAIHGQQGRHPHTPPDR